jgi:hypothetical protein
VVQFSTVLKMSNKGVCYRPNHQQAVLRVLAALVLAIFSVTASAAAGADTPAPSNDVKSRAPESNAQEQNLHPNPSIDLGGALGDGKANVAAEVRETDLGAKEGSESVRDGMPDGLSVRNALPEPAWGGTSDNAVVDLDLGSPLPAGELIDITAGTGFMYDDVAEAEAAGATCDAAGPVINAGTIGEIDGAAPSASQGVYCTFPAEDTDEPVQAAAQPIVITHSYFESLPIAAQTPRVEPAVGWIPVNMPMVVSSTADPEQFDLDVLGTPVSIRAIPVAWTWDWGDGSRDTFETPGAAWPRKDVTHTYDAAAELQVTLTTTYRGEFAVNGGPWQAIDGTTTVTSEPVPMGVEEFESRLVG